MPVPPPRWRHIIINTRNTWLHGDDRGFRSRGHRIHSSGDYKRRPPEGEHAGLYRYHDERSGEEVTLPKDVRPTVGRAILAALRDMHHTNVLCVAVGKVHAHVLVRLPNDYGLVKRVAGRCKHHASGMISGSVPGAVWAEGGTFKMIKDEGHHRNTYGYILYDQGPEAWTWSFRDGSDDGMFGRKRPPGSRKRGR